MHKLDRIKIVINELNLQDDEIVFLSAGLGNFDSLSEMNSAENYFDQFTDLLLSKVPKGCIIVPTYSYSFSNILEESIFSVKNSESKLGMYSNWFLKNVAEYRTFDPMVSCALSNDDYKFLGPTMNSSYGSGSLFENLLKINCSVKILNFGLGVKWMPFIHYLDFICQTPYRYQKFFIGTITEKNPNSNLCWEYHVPVKHPSCNGTGEANGNQALKNGLWTSWNVGRGRVHLTDYKKYFNFTLSETRKNPWNLAFGPPIDENEISRLIQLDLDNEYFKRIGKSKPKTI